MLYGQNNDLWKISTRGPNKSCSGTFSASSRLQGKRLVTDTVEFSQREQDVDL